MDQVSVLLVDKEIILQEGEALRGSLVRLLVNYNNRSNSNNSNSCISSNSNNNKTSEWELFLILIQLQIAAGLQ